MRYLFVILLLFYCVSCNQQNRIIHQNKLINSSIYVTSDINFSLREMKSAILLNNQYSLVIIREENLTIKPGADPLASGRAFVIGTLSLAPVNLTNLNTLNGFRHAKIFSVKDATDEEIRIYLKHKS